MTDHERARMQLAQALTRAENAVVREHIRAAMAALDAEPLTECAKCGRDGAPGRLVCTHCAGT